MLDFSNSKNVGDVEQSDYESLIFPTDYEGHIYPECIKFGIYEREGISLAKLKKAAKGAWNEASTGIVNNIQEGRDVAALEELNNADEPNNTKIQALDAKIANSDGDDRTTVDVVGDSLNNHLGADTDFGKDSAAGIKARNGLATKIKRNIFLNMPNTISFNEAATWEGAEMGVVGALMSGNVAGGAESMASGAFGQLATAAGGGLGTLAGKGLGKVGMGGLIGAAGGFMASGAITDKFETVTNTKSNPFKEQTFQGVDFRSFSFAFKLQARNGGDLLVIRDIIQSFRAYSKPSYKDGSGMFSYPHEFQIEFLTLMNGELVTNEWIPQLKYCICKSVKTDFGEGQWKSFQGGHPLEVSLSLEFTETELITEEDVFGDTAVGRFSNTGGNF